MVDRTTRRESLLVGGDYKLKAPAQTEFNTMEVVGVYRLVDKVHWQLYTARKEILRRMGVVPDGTVEGETNERLGGKVLSTPRDDDEAGEDTLLAELTKLGSPGSDIHPIQAALDADLNEVFLFRGTDPDAAGESRAARTAVRQPREAVRRRQLLHQLASKADQCAATAAAQLLPRTMTPRLTNFRRYTTPFKCPLCQCAWDDRDSPKGEKGISMFLSRVALGRTAG